MAHLLSRLLLVTAILAPSIGSVTSTVRAEAPVAAQARTADLHA